MTTPLTAYYRVSTIIPLKGDHYFAAGSVPQWQQRVRLMVHLAVAVANDPEAPADLRQYCRETLLQDIGEQPLTIVHAED